MNKYKLGDVITIDKNHTIQSFGGKELNVDKGDKAIVTSTGLKYITGEAKGKIVLLDGDIKGCNYDNIANLIYQRLSLNYDLDSYIDDNDLNMLDVVDDISDILMDIL